MDQTNTNAQGGQDLHNLQPGGKPAQGTDNALQTGSGIDTSDPGAANVLNQAVTGGELSVAVVSNGSQTSSIAPTSPVASNGSGGTMLYVSIVFLLILVVAILILRRVRKSYEAAFASSEASAVLEPRPPKRTRKKRKKPKKAHHH